MPIDFEQAAPIAPAISQAYGAAQQWTADAPTLAKLYEAAANNTAATNRAELQATAANVHDAGQAQQASAALRSKDADFVSGQNQQSQQFAAQLQAQAAEAGAHNQTQANIATLQAQSQMDDVQARGQIQKDLAQTELTAQEQQRLVQLKSAKAAVSVDPQLTDKERSDLMGQIDQGINPLAARQQLMTQQHQQLQNQQMMDQHARLFTMDQQTKTLRAKTLKEQVATVNDADGNPVSMIEDGKGGWTPLPTHDKKGGNAEKAEKPFDEMAALKLARLRGETFVGRPDPLGSPTEQKATADKVAEFVKADVQSQRDAHEARKNPEKAAGLQAPERAPGPFSKPFDPNEAKDQTPEQRTIVAAVHQTKDVLAKSPALTEQERVMAIGAANMGLHILAAYGGLGANVPPKPLERLKALNQVVQGALERTTAATQQPAASGGRRSMFYESDD